MLYKLHFVFMTAGANAFGILIGVFMETYTDGNKAEIGALLMMMPFLGLFARPIICSMADRHQAHQKCLIYCLVTMALSYSPFMVIPFFGPDLYVQHSRLCWWLLVSLKVVGAIAFGGASSIGDSLAINYAKRVGAEFGTYRVWGTISWMFFGFFTGQINEVSFLPKYVPAFIILCVASLMDAFVCWLWPAEFFRMVPMSVDKDTSSADSSAEQPQKKTKAIKKLMSDEDVWAQMKDKLGRLIGCQTSEVKVKSVELATVAVEPISSSSGKSLATADQEKQVDKMTQLRILLMLFRKDPRITIYLLFFVCAGATVVPLSFFYMSLSEICNQQGTCNFSKLGGYLQVSMASIEVVLFAYIGRILEFTGRVSLCAISLGLMSSKYFFYGTVWVDLNPYWSLLIEPIHGICFGCYIVLMVELGHKFANEVECIIPEMIERGIIKSNVNVDKVRLSLSATMQALMSAAMDGLGRGFGALIYGIYLSHYSYQSLWLTVGIFSGLVCLVAIAIKLIECIFDPHLGLDVREEPEKEQKGHQQQQQLQ